MARSGHAAAKKQTFEALEVAGGSSMRKKKLRQQRADGVVSRGKLVEYPQSVLPYLPTRARVLDRATAVAARDSDDATY